MANNNDLGQDLKVDKNYFYLTINNLKPGVNYPVQFMWKKDDGTFGPPSATKVLSVVDDSVVRTPSHPDVTMNPGVLNIVWDGKDKDGNLLANFDHIDIIITDSKDTFAKTDYIAGTFKQKGFLGIPVPGGTYHIQFQTVTALGKKSSATTPAVDIVVEPGIKIEAPTLPTGLSATSAPFGILVNWEGTYKDNNKFSGFKSINIYASTTGSSETRTDLSEASIVGSMTVDVTVNKVMIGLESLKAALSLNSTTVYTQDIYLYYNAVNLNNEQYKSNGTITYNRINSTAVHPTKANKVDLDNGIISIENLVAGNGQFTSWMRVGAPGGARIEINGTTDSFIDNSHTVLRGLTIYNSGSLPVFRASTEDGTVTFGGYAPSDLDDISGNASDAKSSAGTALLKSQNFDTSGNIAKAISIPSSSNPGSIYSVKTAFGNGHGTGWFLGWNGSSPVIDVGSDDKYVRWDGTNLTIKGEIKADSGRLGNATDGWQIGNSTLMTYSENSTLQFGDSGSIYSIKRTDGQFTIKETVSGSDNYILNTYGSSGTEGARLYIGSSTRQVEVTKPAQISGYGTDLTQENAIQSSDNRIVQAYRSGGLRNMYTVVDSRWDVLALTANGAYPSAANGDVLLVYTV